MSAIKGNEWTCPSCGNKNRADYVFCMNCGTKRDDAVKQEEVQARKIRRDKCPSCGHEVMPGSKFCKICGAKLTQILQKPAILEYKSDVSPDFEQMSVGRTNPAPKKQTNKLLFPIVAGAVIAVIGIGAFAAGRIRAASQNTAAAVVPIDAVDKEDAASAASTEDTAQEEKVVQNVITEAPEITVQDVTGSVLSPAGTEVYTTAIPEFSVDAQKFPWLAGQLDTLNEYFVSQCARYTADADKQEEAVLGGYTFSFDAYPQITRCDTQYVSIMVSGYFLQEGPINHWSVGVTYDLQAEKPVLFEDVFYTANDVVEPAVTCLNRNVEQFDLDHLKTGDYMRNQLLNSDSMNREGTLKDITFEGTSWSLTPDGAYFYFDANAINPGSSSTYYAEVTAEEYPDIFTSAVNFGIDSGAVAAEGDNSKTSQNVMETSVMEPTAISGTSIAEAGDIFDDNRDRIYTRGREHGISQNASEIREYTVMNSDSGDGDNNILVVAIEVSVHFEKDDEWFSFYNYLMVPNAELDESGNLKDYGSNFSLKTGEQKTYEHSGETFNYYGYESLEDLKSDLDEVYGSQGYDYEWVTF